MNLVPRPLPPCVWNETTLSVYDDQLHVHVRSSLVPRPCGRRKTAWYRLLAHARSFLGIRLRLEIVGKINTYTSDIFPYHRAVCQLITFNSMNVEDNRRVYEGKDAFLWLPTSFRKSVCYEVLSFACEDGVATPLSC